MSTLPRTSPPETGVTFAARDIPGFTVRTVVLAIDMTIVILGAALIYGIGALFEVPLPALHLMFVASSWAYLALLKSGPQGTLGYRAFKLRLVDLQGNQASLWRSTTRFLFFFFGPVNALFDLLWLTTDPNRQALRDKLTKTYVIRRNATPAQTGLIVYPTYFIAGMSFIFAEVSRPESDG